MVKLMSVVVSMVVALAVIGRPTHSTQESSSPPPVEMSEENRVALSLLQESKSECDGSFIRHFFQYVTENKNIESNYKSAFDALEDYLHSCGYEKLFADALDKFEESSSTWYRIVYSSLFGYFKATFPKFYQTVEKLEKALHIISNLHKVDSIPDEAGCKFFKTDLITWLYEKYNDDVIDKFTQAHFEFALEESGLDERFRKVMTKHGIEASPLANYLFRYRNKEHMLRYALHMIDKLASLDQADEPQEGCALDLKPVKYAELSSADWIDDPLADIVRAEIATIKDSEESWRSSEDSPI